MSKVETNLKYLANTFDMTERYARDIFKNAQVKKGVYDFLESVNIYVKHIKELKKTEEANGYSELNRVKTETAKFKLRVLQKEYHKTEDIEFFLMGLITKVKSKVLSIPNKTARLVAGETEIAKIEAIIKSNTDDLLNELAEYDISNMESEEFEE